MRLPAVTRGETFGHRLAFLMIRLKERRRAPDIVRTLMFRSEFFGAKMMFQEVLRGPSEWTVGERELFAAYVSKLNACEY
jgi:alkylhydroperoxidase family enzyme